MLKSLAYVTLECSYSKLVVEARVLANKQNAQRTISIQEIKRLEKCTGERRIYEMHR